MMETEFFKAPLSLQVAIGTGYLAYLAAYTGIRSHHKQIDTAFITLSFGLFAATFFNLLLGSAGLPVSIVMSAIVAVILGVLWRVAGKPAAAWAFRKSHLSFADDDPTVLKTIFGDTQHNVSQVLVTLEDGRELMCQDTGRFKDAAIRPLIIGDDGSVAMYVTHVYRRGADGKQVERAEDGVRDPVWGDNMTIVPANRIQQIDLRFQKKLNRPSSAAARAAPLPEP